MIRLVALMTVATTLVQADGSAPRIPPGPHPMPRPESQTSAKARVPEGKWRVEYANDVIEMCEFQKDGTAVVVEPVRIPGGKAIVNSDSFVIVFENGRIQRWTPVGKRFAVEHWFPGSQFPTAGPGVLGIAERAP